MEANPANADPAATFRSMLARRVPAAAGLLALTLGATPALSAEAVSKETLEQRVVETARVIEKHRHYRNMSPERVERGVEFVTGNILFVISRTSPVMPSSANWKYRFSGTRKTRSMPSRPSCCSG